MKWVLDFDKSIKFKYWTYNLMIILGDIMSLAPPILIGLIVDKGLFGGNFYYALKLCALTVLLVLIKYILAYLGVVNLEKLMYKHIQKIRVASYAKLHEMDRAYFINNDLGEINTILTSDMFYIRNHMSYTFRTMIVLIIQFLGTLIYGLYFNWKLILILLSVTPFMGFLTAKYIKRAPKLYNERRNLLSKLNNRIQENIEGNKIIKNFGLEKNEILKFAKENKALKNKKLETRFFAIDIFSAISFFARLMSVLLLSFGGYFFLKGQITIGIIVALNNMLWMIQRPFYELDELLDILNDFSVSKKHVKELFEEIPKVKNTGNIQVDKIDTITFKNVTIKYEKKIGIKNLNLTINKGQTVAFIGEVGSGKSTIANGLLRYIDPIKGEVLINDINVKDYDLKSIRKKIGYVAQIPFLFSDTILENVTFGNDKLKSKDINKYLKIAKAGYVFDLEKGIDTVIGENGVTLSGGEKQRLALTRALAVEPELLILDDITSALDTETELEVTKNINDLEYSCTKVIVAGKIISVKNADIICVLKNNKVVEQGSHKELLAKNGYYKEIYDIQMNSLLEGVTYEC